jgi:hypothetical protein
LTVDRLRHRHHATRPNPPAPRPARVVSRLSSARTHLIRAEGLPGRTGHRHHPDSRSIPISPRRKYPYCLQCVTVWKNFRTFGHSGSAYYPLVLVPTISTSFNPIFFSGLENRRSRACGTSSAHLYGVRREVQLGLKWR